MTEFSLNERVALVLGGSSGIGLAIAHGFQDAGAKVAIAARTPAKLEAALAGLHKTGKNARCYEVDLARAGDIELLVTAVLRDFSRIGILVNSQGTTFIKPTDKFSEAEYDAVMATNLKSVFFACLAVGRHMVEQGEGAIINIASISAHRGWPGAAVYGASKHGVVGLTHSLAAEWAKSGVRVNAISPGFFMTELNRDKMGAARKERALARTPMGRFGELDELVGAAVYLASPAAKYTTGTVINVDGGYLAAGI
jgi:NAD(P)-dependent dehydrogenase (short-subunit alcohol dehydrogenase family)